jgi:DNA polymerase
LDKVGLVRDQIYVTDAVKHFKWEPRGKRRIHQTPNSRDIAACRPWLAAELRIVRPRLVVCLGATAVRAVFETPLPIHENRGQVLTTPSGVNALITVHPSSLLRMPDEAQRAIDYSRFIDDLRKALP